MKLLVISDGHGNTDALERLKAVAANADAVLYAGDFAAFGKPETGAPFLERLVALHDNVFAVLGNCDEPGFIEELERRDVCAQGQLSFFDGLAIAGSGGGSKFTGATPCERSDEELVSDLAIVRQSAESDSLQSLVLIAHNPPHGTALDKAGGNAHVGSVGIRQFIENFQPVLAVSGHIHESRAVDQIGDSALVNPGSLAEGFYAIAEIAQGEDGKKTAKIELCAL